MPEQYTRYVIRSTALLFASSILAAVFGYLFRLVLARQLEISQFGLFYAVLALVGLVIGFKSLGTGSALVREVATAKARNDWKTINQAFRTFLTLNLSVFALLALGLLAIGPWAAKNYFQDPAALTTLIILVFAHLFMSFEASFDGLLQGVRWLLPQAIFNLIRPALLLAVVLLLFTFGVGILAPAYAYLVVYIVIPLLYAIVAIRRVPKAIRPPLGFQKNMFVRLLAFGLPFNVGIVATALMANFGSVVLIWFRTLSDVGLYNIALPTADILRQIPKALSVVIFPLAAELFARKDSRFSKGLERLYRFIFVAVMPLALALLVFAPTVIAVLFGERYEAAASILRILVVGQLFAALSIPNLLVLAGIGRPGQYAKIYLVGALAMVGLTLGLVPKWGLQGAAVADTIAEIVIFAFAVFAVNRALHVRVPGVAWLKTAIAGLGFVGVMFLLKTVLAPIGLHVILLTVITVIASGLVYAALVLLFRIITLTELLHLFKLAGPRWLRSK